jgi:pimeloyl-ACP methyl ester carboxylesterase
MTTRVLPTTHHRTTKIDGVNIFYREAGPADAPVVLLLHGFPTSSRNRRRGVCCLPKARKCRARGQDVSGTAPPSRMTRSQHSRCRS